MAETAFDMAMMFVTKDGQSTIGESSLQKHPDDTLLYGFKPIQSYDDYSNFFEVNSFEFNMTLQPQEDGVGAIGARAPNLARPAAHAAPGGAPPPEQKGPFDRWRSATETDAKRMNFPLKFDEFSFTRVIDGASPIFFQACAGKQSFRSAALIKRVSVGATPGTNVLAQTFLRMDFTDVLLKSVNWTDGDLVQERCSFTCAKLVFKYRQQDATGRLLEVRQAEWSRADEAQALKKQGA